MSEKLSSYSVIQICLGTFLIIGGISRFIISVNYLSGAESLFLGLGLLFYGLANNTKDESEKGKFFTYSGTFSFLLGVILLFYNTFLG